MASVTDALARSRLPWVEMGPRIWFLAASPSVEYNLRVHPAIALTLVRKEKDVILLPGGNDSTREFAEFCKELLGLSEDQVCVARCAGKSTHCNL